MHWPANLTSKLILDQQLVYDHNTDQKFRIKKYKLAKSKTTAAYFPPNHFTGKQIPLC
jgi:hypothetical protein